VVRYYPYFDRAFQCLKDCIGAQARVPLSMQAVAAAKTVKDLYVGRRAAAPTPAAAPLSCRARHHDGAPLRVLHYYHYYHYHYHYYHYCYY
jgi:hypothetical protein